MQSIKAKFIPAFVALAGFAHANFKNTPGPVTFKRDAKCDTPDADDAPADHDCLTIISDAMRNRDESADLSSGEWHNIGCSEKFKISIILDEGGSVMNEALMDDVQAVMSQCSMDKNNDGIPFKGEISGEGRTTSVFKGGSC